MAASKLVPVPVQQPRSLVHEVLVGVLIGVVTLELVRRLHRR